MTLQEKLTEINNIINANGVDCAKGFTDKWLWGNLRPDVRDLADHAADILLTLCRYGANEKFSEVENDVKDLTCYVVDLTRVGDLKTEARNKEKRTRVQLKIEEKQRVADDCQRKLERMQEPLRQTRSFIAELAHALENISREQLFAADYKCQQGNFDLFREKLAALDDRLAQVCLVSDANAMAYLQNIVDYLVECRSAIGSLVCTQSTLVLLDRASDEAKKLCETYAKSKIRGKDKPVQLSVPNEDNVTYIAASDKKLRDMEEFEANFTRVYKNQFENINRWQRELTTARSELRALEEKRRALVVELKNYGDTPDLRAKATELKQRYDETNARVAETEKNLAIARRVVPVARQETLNFIKEEFYDYLEVEKEQTPIELCSLLYMINLTKLLTAVNNNMAVFSDEDRNDVNIVLTTHKQFVRMLDNNSKQANDVILGVGRVQLPDETTPVVTIEDDVLDWLKDAVSEDNKQTEKPEQGRNIRRPLTDDDN